MLGSNNYLGLTGDPRVKAGRPRRARALRHRPDRLAPAQRHDRRCTSSSSASSPTGWAPRTRSSSRPATRPTSARIGTLLEPGRHGDRPTPATTPRSSTAACSRGAKLRPFRHNRLDKLETMLERAAGDGGGVLVVVDGVFSMEGDIAPLPEIVELCRALRRAADGRRGARRRRARRARRRRLRAARRRGPRRPADGHVLQVARLLRRLHRRARRRDRLPAHPVARRSCSPPPRSRPPSAPRSAALRIIRSDEGPELFAQRARQRRATCTRGLTRPRLPASSRRRTLPDGAER